MLSKISITSILLGVVVFFLFAVALTYHKPQCNIVYDFPFSVNTPQNISHTGDFVEWWYFDGMINEHLSFILTFWLSKNRGKRIEVTIYDTLKNKTRVYYDDIKDDKIILSNKTWNVEIGDNFFSEKEGIYDVEACIKDLFLQFTLVPKVKQFGFRVHRYMARQSLWPWIVPVPRGIINGTLRYEGEEFSITGEGYHEHIYFSSEKDFVQTTGWYWGRFYSENYTVLLGQSRGIVFLLVYEDSEVIISACLSDTYIFEKGTIEQARKGVIPKVIDFTYNNFSISIRNDYISRQTEYYVRFVSSCDIIINTGIENVEKGIGLSDLTFG